MTDQSLYTGNLQADFPLALDQLRSLVAGEPNLYANLANAAALFTQVLPRINWAGFYLLDSLRGNLVLGPFQGLPACIRIPLGKGVCGTAAAEKTTKIVPDVGRFPGHITCDARSRSEVVVPILRGEICLGVIDVDSPEPDRFGSEDARFLEAAAQILGPLFPEDFVQ